MPIQNKKAVRIACLSLLALIGLTSCSDEIKAKSSNYNDPVISINDGSSTKSDIYRNLYSIVEQAYHDGETFKTDVVTEVMYQYAVSMFGQYNKITPKENGSTNTITFKQAVSSVYEDVKNDTLKESGYQYTDKFIDEHKIYQITVDGKRDRKNEYKSLVARWDTIEKRISKAMYDKINADTYKDRTIFFEKKFARALYYDMKSVSFEETQTNFYEGIFTPDVDEEDIWIKDGKNGYLNRSHYQSSFGIKEDESADASVKYVEEEVLPSIYAQLLVEEYIVSQTPNALGRANARKVNIISVTQNDDDPDAAKKFIEAFRDRVFVTKYDTAAKSKADAAAVTIDDFNDYSNLQNGIYVDDDYKIRWGDSATRTPILDAEGKVDSRVSKIYTEKQCNNFEVKTKNEETNKVSYYCGTEFGKIIKEYDKIATDKYSTDTSLDTIRNTYTNSGAYPKELGLEIKTSEVKSKTHVTKGWFIKNGGLSTLPDAIKNRIFAAATATAKKEDGSLTGDRAVYSNGNITYKNVGDNESTYLALINGKYYLKTATQPAESKPVDDIVFHDESSKTYYIIQIEEAANLAKFNDSSTGYTGEKLASVRSSVAKLVAATESYQTLAKKYWLGQMGLKEAKNYHDQQVYDYFQKTYPELFED